MTVIVNEELKIENAAKTYLEMYTEYINGYKQYKLEKTAVSIAVEEVQHFGEMTN